ncbi:poly-beta-1,6 N-acetyl-D-glucosamine synthase IcaA [Staphylococcus kloosii]|uniref:poly-beta-1,6 N-acetyl-D-glucosamine synthase IcaA n=1 Tax=Staphylococcus kloosii TaxID=29384 RepID=UPI0018A07AA8|nr:poly-beta-1,6 N-acetyl-D-glucosamine synthase IcaA [Staphylococcus kloosii]MBF7023030.1 poly-beta-1,6 N-acetyl-D-glucosamine synthase [Staphylococcus kloosii]
MKYFNFLLFYPIFMSIYWIVGSLIYYLGKEFGHAKKITHYDDELGISFLIACYNEGETIKNTLHNVLSLKYKNKEIIVINDGSSDNTADIIREMLKDHDFKFVDLLNNRGKANALNAGVTHAKYDYVMCLDADAIVDQDAPYWMIHNFKNNPNLGAVTGNPRIRNKSSILGKIQTIEYASIIGCIKRSQSLCGAINTVSGVFTLFNKRALEKVGYWDTDMITEDIAVSWKLHLHNFQIKYEPNAFCWMLVPEMLGSLWKQRVRWAQGGHEVILRDFLATMKSKRFALIFLMIEQLCSIVWVYLVLIYIAFIILSANFLDYYFFEYSFSIFLLSAFTMTFINIIQFTVALAIDSRYEKKNIFGLIFLSWYPVMYWLINAAVVIFALPNAIKRKKEGYATWSSPDRGNIQQ